MPSLRTAAIAASVFGVALLGGPAAAQAKVSVGITGWTTQAIGTSPQVKNNKTIDQCLDTGNGQRSLFAIYKGKGISKGTKVSIAVWGGPPSGFMATEPADADVAADKLATFKWPVAAKKSYTSRFGFSFARGPFGPENINGVWNVKVLVKGKVVRRGKVTVAC